MCKRFSYRIADCARLLILVSLLLSTGVSAATHPERGDQFANDGNYEAAVQAFAEAQRLAPRDAVVTAKLAQVSLMLGEDKQALQWAQKAVALKPDSADYQMLLGDTYASYVNDVSLFSKLGIAHKVRDAYLKAVELKPGSADTHYRLAMFYLTAPGIAGGSSENADEQIQTLEKLDPAMAAILRARQARNAKQYAKAEGLLRKGSTMGKDGSAYLVLGDFLASRKRPLDALAAYRQAIAAYPHEPDAYYQIGNLSAEGKIDAQTGISSLQAYLGMPIDWREGNQAFCWAHYRLAQIWARLGDTNKAGAEYQQALALDPGFKQARPPVIQKQASK